MWLSVPTVLAVDENEPSPLYGEPRTLGDVDLEREVQHFVLGDLLRLLDRGGLHLIEGPSPLAGLRKNVDPSEEIANEEGGLEEAGVPLSHRLLSVLGGHKWVTAAALGEGPLGISRPGEFTDASTGFHPVAGSRAEFWLQVWTESIQPEPTLAVVAPDEFGFRE